MQNNLINENELPIGIYKTTISGEIVYANNAFLKLLGYNDFVDLKNINAQSLFVDLDIRKTQINNWNENIIQSSEFELYRKDGKIVSVIDNGYKTTDNDGNIYFIGSLLDITEKKLTEKKLIESESNYRELFDSAVDGILLMNEKGIITDANKVFFELFDIELHNIINQNVSILFSEDELISNPLKYKQLKNNESQVYIRQITRKDKSKIWVEIHTKKMKDGKFQSFFHNINNRINAEQIIEEYKKRIVTIIDSIEAGIFVIDAETHIITDANRYACKIIGLKKQEIEGEICHKFICPAEIGKCPISDLKQTVDKSERNLICGKGHNLPILKTITPIILNNKKHLLEVFIDITEQRKNQEEIKRKNKLLEEVLDEKNKFFSILAHDLRSPFNAFLGLTEIMANELNTMTLSHISEITKRMHNSAINLFSLLENLLLWSSNQRGLISNNPETLQINNIIHQIINQLSESIKSKSLNINIESDFEDKVFADNQLIQTILRNIISNAIKFTPEKGKILIKTKKEKEKYIEIQIQDSGIGMTQEIIDNIFSFNKTILRKGTNDEPSTGLGLMICKEFIEILNGEIHVKSEENKGSSFYILLPIKK